MYSYQILYLVTFLVFLVLGCICWIGCYQDWRRHHNPADLRASRWWLACFCTAGLFYIPVGIYALLRIAYATIKGERE